MYNPDYYGDNYYNGDDDIRVPYRRPDNPPPSNQSAPQSPAPNPSQFSSPRTAPDSDDTSVTTLTSMSIAPPFGSDGAALASSATSQPIPLLAAGNQ
jgi:hypothetical protein